MGISKSLSRRTMLKLAATTVGGIVGLAACGATPTPTPTAAPKAAAPTAVPAATPAPAKVVEIQFRPQTGASASGPDLWRKAVDNVMAKKPHLKITMSGATYSNQDEQQLITAMAAGTGPDCWGHGGSSGGFWGAKNVATPIDDLLKSSPMAGDYYDAELMPHSWGGKLYALPWRLAPSVLQWRKDFFTAAGLNPDQGPKDWTELAEMGKKLAVWKDANTIERAGFAIPANGPHFYFGLFMHQAGGGWFTEDFKKTRINEPAGIEALQFCVDLYQKFKVNATYALTASTAGVPLMVTGQAAMDWMNINGYYYAKKSAPDLLPKWGAGVPPKGPKSAGNIIFVDTMLINSASKVKEACWEMMVELSTYENLELLCPEQGALVPRKSWFDKFPDKVKADPIIGAGIECLKIAYPVHWGPNWTPFRIAMIPFLEEAILLKRSAKDALDAAANKLNSEVLTG